MSFVRRTTFDPGPAPAGYIAGLGRGATGFTTRSDIGEARPASFGAAPSGGDDGGDQHADYSESTYDQFSGYSENLFAGAEYDESDREADSIWAAVDARMEERNEGAREKRKRIEMERLRKETPKVQLEFADLTKKLGSLSDEDWMSIPEVGDSHVRKNQRAERYVPVPDSMLAAAAAAEKPVHSVSAGPDLGGGESRAEDLTSVGRLLKLQLDTTLAKASSSVAGQTAVNSTGYMTSLNASRSAADDMVDLAKARVLLANVTTTNPSHAPGWIAAARLEHIAGKISTARKIMLRGCQACPKNEDVWLEAARLHTPENARVILARAVQNVPMSVKIWLSAAHLEDLAENKKRVLRKGIELVPTSVDLWKAAIELEAPDDAKIMLRRAVEFVPHSVEMWLALAHMEPYKEARSVLNRAREAIPTDPVIWITAARLEESQGNDKGIVTVISRAVKNLAASRVVISRAKWLEEAYKAEQANSPKTAHAIVHETLGLGVEDLDRKRTWMADADTAARMGQFHTARAIYAHALSVFPNKKSVWRLAAELEKAHGTVEALESVLADAVRACPKSEILWLFAAREQWRTRNNADSARKILQDAFAANPESERIWLAAVRLESDCGEQQRARALLQRARVKSGTAKVWIKSVKLELLMDDSEAARTLLQEAITVHPKVAKLWLLYADLELRTRDECDTAREVLQRALKNCPQSVELWLAAASLEERAEQTSRARAVLESGRLKIPASPPLYLASIELEVKDGNTKYAESLLAKALQECPTSGPVWAKCITMAVGKQKKERCVDALKKNDQDAVVLLAVARVFNAERLFDKAKTWLERAVVLNPKLGDAWVDLYRFVKQNGTAEELATVVERCERAAPVEGVAWRAVSKSLQWLRRQGERDVGSVQPGSVAHGRGVERPVRELLLRVVANTL